MIGALIAAYEVERLLFRIALLALVAKLISEAWGAWRARRPPAVLDPPAWPLVTVQIPIRNEVHVVERVLRAAARLDYPAFEIQVLDDSDDATRELADRVAADLRAQGCAIEVIRRADQDGAKAGALAFGLTRARGEYVAIFDADFIPQPAFLRQLIPHVVADPRVGMVQGRWAHLDRDASLLARTQALVLDGLMLVEQPAKAARDQPLHFNGTAGVWRCACIADAGGWSGRSITEDLELSQRASRRGWKLRHLTEVAVPAELPHTMRAFRAQQLRWTRGNAQVLRASWRTILTAPLPWRQRLAMLVRTSARLLYVFLAILTIGMPVTTFTPGPWSTAYGLATDGALLAVVVAALCAYYLPAARRATGSAVRSIVLIPFAIALSIGLSPACAVAYLAGLVRRDAAFVRTPKWGAARPHDTAYRLPLDPLIVVEFAIGGAYVGFAALAASRGLLPIAAFFAFWAAAHLWVGIATVAGR